MSIKNILIGIAIAILSFTVVLTGIETFYPSPDYNDFCVEIRPNLVKPFVNETVCTQDAKQCPDGTFVGRDPSNNCEFFSCENIYEKCSNDFQEAQENYSRNLFIITTIIGIVLLGIGAFLFSLESVGGGLMGGSLITLLYGSISYWQYAEDLFRFILSILGLALVIFLAYWLNNKLNKKSKSKFKLFGKRK